MTASRDDYCTPKWLIQSIERVMGKIITDPWTNETALKLGYINPQIYGTADNMLDLHKWKPPVWGNPPYSRNNINRCVNDWLNQYLNYLSDCFNEGKQSGHFGMMVTNTVSSSPWYQELLNSCIAFCMLGNTPDGARIAFINPDNCKPKRGNNYAQTIFYFGRHVETFKKEFRQYGYIAAN